MTTATRGGTELEPEHAEIVRATLPLIGARIDEITTVFYRTLFADHPTLIRDLFNRGNQAEGTQPRALAASIAFFATHLVDPDLPHPAGMLARIGHKHASLGIAPEQYGLVHDELFAAIVEVLGADTVTPPVAAAWDRVYWLMADTLIDLERRLYRDSGTTPDTVFRPATVTARAEDTPEVTVFTVTADPLPDFLAGQYVSVRVTLPDGARQIRQYSLLGAPGSDVLEFAVKRVDDRDAAPAGEVSTFLHTGVAVGDTLEISHPFGDITLDTTADTPLVLLSAGIGATPMIGILEHLAATAPHRPVTIAHADRSPITHPLRARHLDLSRRLTAATLELWYDEPTPGTHAGPLDLSALTLPADSDIYVCGPLPFLDAVRAALRDRGIPAARVHIEQFTPTDWREG
ncbi:globin domain-containing protein [Nocardia takedensis]